MTSSEDGPLSTSALWRGTAGWHVNSLRHSEADAQLGFLYAGVCVCVCVCVCLPLRPADTQLSSASLRAAGSCEQHGQETEDFSSVDFRRPPKKQKEKSNMRLSRCSLSQDFLAPVSGAHTHTLTLKPPPCHSANIWAYTQTHTDTRSETRRDTHEGKVPWSSIRWHLKCTEREREREREIVTAAAATPSQLSELVRQTAAKT